MTQTANAAPATAEPMTRWLLVVLAVVIFAGGLFGYDQGVISGALAGIKSAFSLSTFMVQVVTSWVTLGALVGSLVAGQLGDWLGRKQTLLFAGGLFALGAVAQWAAPSPDILVAGRFVVGAAVGVAAVAAPLYAAELAPARVRGRFISSYQLAITIGIFLAYLVNGSLSAEGNWRLMLGAAAFPGIALFLIALAAPESPRWLMLKRRRADATAVLHKVEPGIDFETQLNEIDAALLKEKEAAPWSEIFAHQWRRPLVVALGLAIFQQITGINAIIYYANQIFASAGFATEEARATVTTWAIGGVNVAATLIAIAFIDRMGRRLLLLAGLIGMGVSLAVVGVAFRYIGPDAGAASSGPTTAGIVTVAALVVFITSFAFSLGPVVWTVINEIFPARVRGRGVALATAVNWGSAYIVSQFFLSLVDAIGSSLTFFLFTFFCVVGWIWVYRAVPETKQKSLEEIQGMWGTAG
ncbi:MAG TPA: sugar porter family MFS transporter [Alphaproteobacteria bacterium]|nr:sugar porter family MFS transporter [Alphaproteobacteria bacterium]